jgi:hypothetical protein
MPSNVIYTRPANFPDMGIESDGHVHGDLKEWRGSQPGALVDTDKLPSSVQHMADAVITAAKIASNAITAAKLASDSITSDELASSASDQIRDAILDRVLSSNHDASDTPGAFLQQLDAAISSRSSHSAGAVWSEATRTLTANTNLNDPTAASIADAMWEEPHADHTTSSTFGGRIQLITTNTADTNAKVATLAGRITSSLFDGITSLAEWLGLLAGKQTGDATARTEIRATGAGSGTYDETTDSQEAIRDRGDAGWTSGTATISESDKNDIRDKVLKGKLSDVPAAEEGSLIVNTQAILYIERFEEGGDKKIRVVDLNGDEVITRTLTTTDTPTYVTGTESDSS